MLDRSEVKDDFESTVARLGVAAATRRAVRGTANQGKRALLLTLQAASIISNTRRSTGADS